MNKRIIKNIIMTIVVIISVLSIILTINYKINNNSTSNTPKIEESNTPPSMPNNSSNNTPPSRPSSDSSTESTEKGQNNNEQSTNNTPPSIPNNNSSIPNNNSNNMYYIIFSLEGLVLSLSVGYLILSGFNKKTFKETFNNKDKIVIYILFILLVTGAVGVVPTFIKNNTRDVTTQSQNIKYSAKKEITKDESIEEEEISSTKSNENAVSVSGAKGALKNVTIEKEGDSNSSDTSSFYGTNSAVLAKDKGSLTITNSNIETNARGANAVFSYGGSTNTNSNSGDGTTITIKGTKIKTTKDSSGGIMASGGGKINAEDLNIETSGTSSAAIRSDRGGGVITVNKGTYKTTGQGSPTIYSTADITVKNAKLISTASEGVVVEGKNKVTLENVDLTDTNNKLNGQSTTYKNIFLYQSTSGDAKEGTSTFTAKDSNITTNKGDTFYITNTKSKITLENNTIKNNDKKSYFLRAQTDSWGPAGSNGGEVELTLKNQKVEGDIYIDSVSTLDMSLTNKSSYTGSINKENIAKNIKLSLSKNSKLKLTSNTYVTELDDEDTNYSNIDFNGYKLYVNGKAIN